ncbi:hypothetical protein L7F22_052206 [Adiantum nelumboides]|nr:hypothetical protein [Adiantum nelumboides]
MHISPTVSTATALLLLVLPHALLIHAADPQSLSLSPPWSFSANLSFPSSSSSLNSYTGISPFSLFAPILSSSAFASGSKGFSFGFLSAFETPSSSPSHISLAICLGVAAQVQSSSSDGARTPFLVPVWTLQVAMPLQQRGKVLVKLQVDGSKQLLLVDGDGSVVWALSNADRMEMQSNGNLVIYDSSNETIWQSFEHPADCLLQGQRLTMGMELTSSNNMYKAAMQAGGVVLYQVSANSLPLVYWVYFANRTVDSYFDNMVGAFSLDKNAPVNFTSSVLNLQTCAELNASLAYYVLDGANSVVQDACGNVNLVLMNITADLVRYLPLVEFAYNNTLHTSTRKAPFEIVVGGKKVSPILCTKDKIFEANHFVEALATSFAKIKEALQKSQERHKKVADKHRRQMDLKEDDWVLLKFEKARLRKKKRKSDSIRN